MKTKLVLALMAACWVCACGDDGKGGGDAGSDAGDEACTWDEDDSAGTASALALGTAVEGYICPVGDQDWYSFSLPGDYDLLQVDLSFGDAPVTPLNLTYGVWDGAVEDVLLSPHSSEAVAAGEPLSIVHGLAAGDYYAVVRDRGDDGEDVWHPYSFMLSGLTDPDPNEPNNAVETATEYGSAAMQGYIAYRGDEDWYRIEAQAHDLLQLRLTMPAGGIEPAYRVVDTEDVVLVSDVNEGGKFEPTDLSYVQALATAGTYYVVVHDDNNLDYDLENPYEIELSLSPDPDDNEANDHPDDATGFGALNCKHDRK